MSKMHCGHTYLSVGAVAGFVCGLSSALLWFWSAGTCSVPFVPTTSIAMHTTPTGPCTIAPDRHLRILPIGDSITAGWGALRLNSYRKDLEEMLVADCPNRTVEYIGSQQYGNWENNMGEGWPGYSINAVMEKTGPALFGDVLHKPNVVLIHLGTNDLGAWHEEPYDTAPERLGKLMNLILFGARNTTVIVAKIIQGSQGKEINKPERITIFNEGVQKQVDSRAASGFKIMAVDMSMIGVDGEDLNDGLHPNEEGYRKMAIKWYEGMKEISDKGWISNVEDINNPYSTNAEDVSANVALAKANMEIEFN